MVRRALSPKQVAERLGLPVGSVRELLRKGILPGFRVPGSRAENGTQLRWRVDESDLEAFVARAKEAAAPRDVEQERFVPVPEAERVFD